MSARKLYFHFRRESAQTRHVDLDIVRSLDISRSHCILIIKLDSRGSLEFCSSYPFQALFHSQSGFHLIHVESWASLVVRWEVGSLAVMPWSAASNTHGGPWERTNEV